MKLDSRGIVSVIEIIVYVPLLLLSLKLLAKYGFKREGWLYLLILSIIRIAGSVTHIISEQTSNPSANLEIVLTILETSGLSPLLIATIGFLGTVKQNAFEPSHPIDKVLKAMRLLATVALILTIVGGVNIGSNESSDNVDKINSGNNFRHIGVILFVVQMALTVLVTFFMWGNIQRIMRHRRTLLKAITVSLPFLAVRVLYSVLSAYAPLGIPGVTSGSPSLAKFNSSHGDFGIWLVMSVIMEFIVEAIYVTAGLFTPLQNDFIEQRPASQEALYLSAYAPPPGHTRNTSSIDMPPKGTPVPPAYPPQGPSYYQ